MVRVGISVEGATEEEFVKQVIKSHLHNHDVDVTPVIVTTKQNVAGPNHKGGGLNLDRAKGEIRRLLPSFDYVTTLYDFYGFRGRREGETAADLRERLAATLGRPASFTAYFQIHEFEALLFSDPTVIGAVAGRPREKAALEQAVTSALTSCGGAEEVNDSPQTAPSKRLTDLFSRHVGRGFDKRRDGVRLIQRIGLAKVRGECPRFNEWLSGLEALGDC